jgi:hypothetical protein
MPLDPKVQIVKSFDDVTLEPGGGTLEQTVVRFMFGRLGPFEVKIARTASEYELEQKINERIAPFRSQVGT